MAPTPQENAALVREFLSDVVAGGDTDALGMFLTDDAVHSQPGLASPTDVEHASAEEWLILAGADVDITIEGEVAAGDRVAIRGRVTGTHRESLMDLVPTGRSFEIAIAWFCRIENGRIGEIWSLPDRLGLMRQLEAVTVGPRSDDSPTQAND